MSGHAQQHDNTLKVKPSQFKEAIRKSILSGVMLFGWGPPGVAKSTLASTVATEMGMAIADIRLSSKEPSDITGMPYPTVQYGVQTVGFTPPKDLPRDIDLDFTEELPYADSRVFKFQDLNPLGGNGIHYCQKLDFTVRPVAAKHLVAKVIDQSLTHVEVALFETDENGQATDVMAPGLVRITVKGEARVLIVYDECNAAPRSVMAATYGLFLDRRHGFYRIPDGCAQMALGNRNTDKGVTYDLPEPVKNRLTHVELDVDHKEWSQWAIGAGIHPQVVAFLEHMPNHLFQFSPNSASRGWASPRSWEFVSKLLSETTPTTKEVLLSLIIGCVGESSGRIFWEHREKALKLPNPDLILEGKLKLVDHSIGINNDIALQYALVHTLNGTLKTYENDIRRKYQNDFQESEEYSEWLAKADNYIGFVNENFKPDIAIMGIRVSVKQYNLAFNIPKMPKFKEFTLKNKSLLNPQD